MREQSLRALERLGRLRHRGQGPCEQSYRRRLQDESRESKHCKKKAWGVLRSRPWYCLFQVQSEGDASGELEIARGVDQSTRNAKGLTVYVGVNLREGTTVEGVQRLSFEREGKTLMDGEGLQQAEVLVQVMIQPCIGIHSRNCTELIRPVAAILRQIFVKEGGSSRV